MINLATKDDCKRMENVHSNYGTITEGFNAYFKGIEMQKAGFFDMKRTFIDGMHYVKNEFSNGGKKYFVFTIPLLYFDSKVLLI